MGSVEGGLVRMAWSPDQELAVFCTGHASLLLMTHQLDPAMTGGHELVPVIETPLFPEDFGEGGEDEKGREGGREGRKERVGEGVGGGGERED